jgi:multicomponent Na+:H+ antiporter subunit F
VSVVYTVALAGLGVSAALILVRLLRGPHASDRIVALDTLLLVVVGAVAVQIARLEERAYAGVLVVVSLLAFVGTVTVARFLDRREDP